MKQIPINPLTYRAISMHLQANSTFQTYQTCHPHPSKQATLRERLYKRDCIRVYSRKAITKGMQIQCIVTGDNTI